MFDLVNIFGVFLPQLLLYPNATDPLNGEAASLMMQDKEGYNKKVQEYVGKYASSEVKIVQEDSSEDENMDSEEEFSDIDDDGQGSDADEIFEMER